MYNPRILIVVGCAVALVAGCASYKPEPISPAANARALDSRTLSELRLRKFIALELARDAKSDAPLQWDLTTLTLAAIYYHPDLDIAHAKLAAAEAAVVTARQAPNPVLRFANMFQSAAAGAIPAGAAPLTIGPVIDIVLETFGKREKRTAQAEHLADAARWDLATAGWQVRGRVRTALLNLWAARRRLVLMHRRLDLQDQLVGLLDRRLGLGEASSVEVSRERIKRDQLAFAMRDFDRADADARVELATAIGIPVQALDGMTMSLETFEHPPAIEAHLGAGTLRRKALTARAEIQASLQHYEAAQSGLQLAVANQYPNVRLSPGYNYDLGVDKYILDLGADLPIFHQNQGPIAEALARRQQAAANFTAVQARIIGAIDRATTAYRKAAESVAAADALLADEERRARRVEALFRAGQVDRPALVTTRLEVATTAFSRFDPVVQQRQALGALEDALQQPLFDPGQWPEMPEENPRLAHPEPAS